MLPLFRIIYGVIVVVAFVHVIVIAGVVVI